MSGKIKNTGRKSCSIRELAAHIGLSTCTVSKVLNDRAGKKIPKETQERVLAAARELNYVPNVNAQRFFRRRSFVIGLLVPPQDEMGHNAFRDTHLCDIVSGIESALSRTRYNLLMLFNRPEYKHENRYAGLFSSGMLDGLLIWGASYLDVYDRELGDYPVIFLNSRPKGLPTFNFIGHDNFRSLFDMTEHAIAQGGRKFLYFSGTNTNSINEDRRNGFMAALQKHELSLPRDHFIQAEFRHDLAFRTMNDILDAGQLQFDTVICANDAMAEGVYDAAAKHNLRLPDAFRLAGGDRVNEEYDYNYNSVQITAFAIDCFTQGITATRQLIDLIEGKITGTHSTLLPTQFLQRQTL